MARATGFTCDRPECGTFVVSPTLPDGWLTLDPNDKQGGKFEICSNRCLRMFAQERERAEKQIGRTKERNYTAQARAAIAGNLIRWHREGKHKNDLREGCPMCEEETAPVKP